MTVPVLRLMNQKRTLGFHLETTRGTKETLTGNNYSVPAYNIGYTPEIESYARKIARGDMSWDNSVSGKRSIEITFSVDMNKSAAANVAPRYFEALRACKMYQEVHSTTGVSCETHAEYDNQTATIEVVERQEGTSPKQLVVAARGAMGDFKIMQDAIGQPCRIDFTFKGVLDSITTRAYASILTPASFDAYAPDATLAATISLYATTMYLGKFSVAMNNKIELFTDPSKSEGFDYARVVETHPTLELDPDMLVTDDFDWLSRHTSNTTGALSVQIGSNLTLYAPAAQIVQSYNPGDREGHVVNNIRCELQRSSGNDEFKILQGAE